jgi:hypothetical protein
MPTVHLQAEITGAELLKAAEQLSPTEFSDFLSSLLSLRARREANGLPASESQLMLRINQGLPDELRRRYQDLIGRRQQESLDEPEYEELMRLSDLVEHIEVERLEALDALARLRGIPLGSLMSALEIPEPSHE